MGAWVDERRSWLMEGLGKNNNAETEGSEGEMDDIGWGEE